MVLIFKKAYNYVWLLLIYFPDFPRPPLEVRAKHLTSNGRVMTMKEERFTGTFKEKYT